ncbi:MAG: response regulator, partial [bacterium]|nr:response regulator [bacterium]
IVEDSMTQAILTKNILTGSGYKVTVRENGIEALDFLKKEKVDLILSDINMPLMNGFSLCKKVKDNPGLKNIPFILITGLTDVDSVIRSLNCGADNYLNKPIIVETLLSTIESMILPGKIINEAVFSEEITLNGKDFVINAKPSRILNLLLTLYSDIKNKNNELIHVNERLQQTREKLGKANEELELKLLELKISEEEFRLLVETIPDIVYKINSEGIFTFVNDAVKNIGYRPEELIGKHFSCIISPEQIEELSRKIVLQKSTMEGETGIEALKFFDEQRSGDRKTTGLEISLITKNKNNLYPEIDDKSRENEITVEVNASGIFENSPKENRKEFIGTVGVIHDISQHIVLEKQLEKAKFEAERANNYKSQFLANMSHEIRTPMNAIIGLGYLLDQTTLDKRQKDYLRKIDISAKNLLKIINSILDFSKIEAGKIDFEDVNFNLHNVVNNLKDVVSGKVESKDLELIFDIDKDVPSLLVGDPLRLTQVLINLANNSIKFTEKGNVTIQIKCLEETGEYVFLMFKILDTGIGIEEDKIENLFKPFNQADSSTSRKYGGTGLGLVICKHLIELMGGTIEVKSKFGFGSEFTICIKLRLNKTEEKRTYYNLFAQSWNHMNVLIIDNNKSVVKALSKMVMNFNFTPFKGYSGSEAIKILKRNKKIDLIIMEYNMIGLNGFDTIIEIINNKKIRYKPKIILLLEKYNHAIMNHIKELKIEEFFTIQNILVKPISPSMIYDSIMDLFNIKNDLDNIDKVQQVARPEYIPELLRILLVEDNEINQDVAVGILTESGFQVDIAGNGKEAVDLIFSDKVDRFDLVLMDLDMPVMNGFEATEIIRNKDKELPIIAMTADAIKGVEERVLDLGMNGYISKPVDPVNLVRTIRRIRGKNSYKNNLVTIKEIGIEQEFQFSLLKYINYKVALNRIQNNEELFYNILVKFKNQNINDFERISNSIGNKEYKKAKSLVHSLKGVAGNIGADELFEKLKYINSSLESDIIRDDIKTEISGLETDINNVLSDINSIIK